MRENDFDNQFKNSDIYQKFSETLSLDDPEALFDAGIAYATEQMIDLISRDVRGIHLYTMNSVETARRIYRNIGNLLSAENK